MIKHRQSKFQSDRSVPSGLISRSLSFSISTGCVECSLPSANAIRTPVNDRGKLLLKKLSKLFMTTSINLNSPLKAFKFAANCRLKANSSTHQSFVKGSGGCSGQRFAQHTAHCTRFGRTKAAFAELSLIGEESDRESRSGDLLWREFL